MFVFKMILPSMHGYKELLNYVPDSCHNSQSLEFFRGACPPAKQCSLLQQYNSIQVPTQLKWYVYCIFYRQPCIKEG